jgi:hypothetical protein
MAFVKDNITIRNRGLSTTHNSMYIFVFDDNHDTNADRKQASGYLQIQFVPSDISTGRKGNFAESVIIGRNHPKYQYIGGEDVLTMTLDFYADERTRTSVYAKVQWLKALIANDGYLGKCPRVGIALGNMFAKDVFIMDSVDAQYDNLSRTHGMMPQQAYVNISLKQDPTNNLRWADIRTSNSQAGVQDDVQMDTAVATNDWKILAERTALRYRLNSTV